MADFCTIYIVRHGETDWNAQRLVQGHSDTPLNKIGEIQAKELALKFKNIKIDKVFSSDLLRAKRTAEIIVLEKKLAVETTKILRERRFGKYEGQHASALETLDQILRELDKEARFKYRHEGEIDSDEDLINRIIPFLREVAISNPDKTILTVTHGGVLRSLIRHIQDMDLVKIKVENLAYIKLKSDGEDFEVIETSGINYEE